MKKNLSIEEFEDITIIGSGNVATQIALALTKSGVPISQVWSRKHANARALAEQVNASALSKLEELKSTDLIIVAIADDAIADFFKKLPLEIPVVHTSGNTELIERNHNAQSGVFYPLQTFSKEIQAEWSSIPFCLEANSVELLKQLTKLAEKLSNSVQEISSAQRKTLHVAAVMACNFTNHLSAISEDFLTENQLSLDLIKPLIARTFSNIQEGNVKSKQTGPAVRKDQGTIDAHVKLLSSHPDLQTLYLALSNHIITYHHGE